MAWNLAFFKFAMSRSTFAILVFSLSLAPVPCRGAESAAEAESLAQIIRLKGKVTRDDKSPGAADHYGGPKPI